MKKAIPWLVASLLVILITSCFLFEKKLSPIINLVPVTNSTLIGPEVSFGWNGGTFGEDQTLYSLFLGISEDALTEVASEITSKTVNLDLECNRHYFWKVVAKTLTLTAESEAVNFYLIDGMTKNPLPSDKATEVSIDASLSWETNQVEGSDYTYSVYFAEGNVPALVQEDLTQNSFDPGDLKNGTKYSWKIVVKAGSQTKESPVWSFTTIPDPANNAPTKPGTPTPEDEAVDQAVDVQLSWQCSDPDGDTLEYDIYFGSNTNPPLITSGHASQTLDPGILSKGTTYYWKVVAKDGRGGVAESDKWSFTTVTDPANNPPSKPNTPIPANGAINQSVDVNLQWKCTDPDGDPLKYDVYFGSNPSPSLVSYEQSSNTFDPGTLSKGTTYYWKVVAKDGRGGVTESDKWSFTTVPDPTNNSPAKPNTPTPADGAVDQAIDVNLGWTCSDPDGDPLKYDIYFGSSETPPLVVNEQSSNSFDPGTLSKGTTYYWKVVAKDGRGGITESDKWSFNTSNLESPHSPSPSDDATDVLWDGVTLSWEVAGDTSGLYYDIYFGKDEIPGIYRIGYAATELTVTNLDRGETYYWQIVVTDEPYTRNSEMDTRANSLEEDAIRRRDGAAAIGNIWSFTTKENRPPVLVSMTPTDEATDISPAATLSWEFTDEDGDELVYDLYLDRVVNPRILASNIEDGSYSPFLYSLADYYWKVVAKDGQGGRTETNVYRFTTHLIQWQKCLGGSDYDVAYSIQQTSDGGYIVAGYTYSNDGDVSGNHGSSDYWVVKLNSVGAIDWQKCLGGSSTDRAHSIQQTSDGGYIVAGVTYSSDGDFSDNHGGADYWIVKLNSLGDIDWQKCLGGSSSDWAHSIQQTSDGGYIVAGYTYSNNDDVSGNHGDADFWVVKLESNGDIEWQKCLGGTLDEYATSVQQTSDGGYIVTGETRSNDGDVSGNHGSYDYWVVKLDQYGTILWKKCFGGSNGDWPFSVQQTSDGGYIVAGETWSNDGNVSGNHGSSDFWLAKLDASGSLLWQKCLGGTSNDVAHSIQKTSDGGYIVAGQTYSNNGDVSGNHGAYDYWMVKLESNGDLQWQKCLGGTSNDVAYSVQQRSGEGHIVAGETHSNNGNVSDNHGYADYWVVKTGIVED